MNIVISATWILLVFELCRIFYTYSSHFGDFLKKSCVRRNFLFSTIPTQFLFFAPLFSSWYNYFLLFWRAFKYISRICVVCSFQKHLLQFVGLIFYRDMLNWKEPIFTNYYWYDMSQKRKIEPNLRVTGLCGERLERVEGDKRKKRRRLYGVVLSASGRNVWNICWDGKSTT